jgi:hypothetical protein
LDRRLLPPSLQALGLLALALPAERLAGPGRVRPEGESRPRERRVAERSLEAGAQSPPGEDAFSRDREAGRAALARGLDWLAAAAATTPDGSLPRGGAEDAAPVAVTSLAALAWMAGGDGPERGRHGNEIARAIDWIVAHTELDPRAETAGYVSQSGDGISRMHGHGLATLALAQASGLPPKSERGARIDRALRAAIGCIERSQGVEGGWYYQPKKTLEHEGSITICEVQALRASHNAGFPVQSLTIARALDYLARSQKEDGSFRYALGDERSTLALTAAAVATLHAAGKYEGKPLEDAYGYLIRGLAARDSWIERHPEVPLEDRRLPEERDERHAWCAYYERLYLAQALWQHPERDLFERWFAAETKRVLTSQREDGSWHDDRFGDVYATATNCLVLALPEGLLPIFQR